MGLATITDYATRAVGRLLSEYRGKARLEALASEIGASAQGVEDAIWALVQQTSLSTAMGIWLDRLGAIVGEAREGADDNTLSSFWIPVRVVANRSNGTVLALSIIGGTSVLEMFPAGVQITYAWPIDDGNALRMALRLRTMRAVGVGGSFLYQPTDNAHSFTFATSSSLESSSLQGFGDSSNSATGGQLAGALSA